MATTFTGTTINDLDTSTPDEVSATLQMLDDAIREIKLCLKNTYGVEHDQTTGKHTTSLPFFKTATITAAAAGTAVVLLPDSDIPTGKSAYLAGYYMYVNGASDWAGGGMTTLDVRENGGATTYLKIAKADLTGNAILNQGHTASSVTTTSHQTAYRSGTGTAAGKGFDVKANANANSGSDVIVTIYGVIK